MSFPREIKLASVRNLRPSKRNARTHSKKQIEQIVQSIRRFGWTCPIIVDEDGVILAGFARYLAAKKSGLKQVPVIVISGLSDAEKRALAIADNKIAANAGWDRNVLAAELCELAVLLPECNLSLDITGFEAAEIDSILGDLVDPEVEAADIPPVLEKVSVTRPGDIWQLSPHRLLCADATQPAAFERLMGSERAQMVFADPPYNLQIASIVGRGRLRHREFSHASGEMTPDQFVDFSRKWMSSAAQYSVNGSIHFVCMDWRHLGEIYTAGAEAYDELKNLVVWNKTNAGQGSLYRSQHELICVYKRGHAPHVNNVELGKHGRNRSNVWSYAGINTFRAGRLEDLSAHPTVKPIALIADAMRDCSRRGDIVLDPFIGFGTTIMVAERVGRRAFGIEIDRLYVDATIRRWQQFTRKDATLAGSQLTFDDAAKSRVRVERRLHT
jgi:DNA modification methylase